MRFKITIITAVLNDPKGLLKTITSVSHQKYKNVEHIIIDGGSQQESLHVLENKAQGVTRWISEPDKGISDAFNKGIALSSGEYLCFLGAGDVFFNDDVLSDIFDAPEAEEMSQYDIIAGKIQRMSFSGQPLWIAPKNMNRFNKKTLLFKLGLPHQGMFMHKRYFNQYGLFDLNFKYAMDYELLLRSYHHFPKVKLVDKIIANWLEGGVGTGKILEIYQEYHDMKLKNKIAPVYIVKLIDKWLKLKYKIRSKISSWRD